MSKVFPFRPSLTNLQGKPEELRGPILDKKQDISIVFVETPFELNEFTAPACLPKKLPVLESTCYVSGYGHLYRKSEDDDPVTASHLMTAPTKIVDNKTVESKCKTHVSLIIFDKVHMYLDKNNNFSKIGPNVVTF